MIAAKLDLTDARQRIIHGAIAHMHTGKDAMFRALGMRQAGDLIYEAAEQLPREPGKRPRYTVVTWNLAECGLRWKCARSRREALATLRTASESARMAEMKKPDPKPMTLELRPLDEAEEIFQESLRRAFHTPAMRLSERPRVEDWDRVQRPSPGPDSTKKR
jgi:hypothetical protein